ncbi:heat shock cognate 71 kDa protein-like [Peromyscus leucopus]|uniref:heat shock cognate 71 kDa protein-like n=1 Tax=Peromyscus leucopus TaxID=10041 RepID=UPI001885788D|nr:heat shock cognate 71 kDa protein-like [Peromyscus leucopus]
MSYTTLQNRSAFSGRNVFHGLRYLKSRRPAGGTVWGKLKKCGLGRGKKKEAEDEKQRDKVSSKNSLESYAFNMKATVEDEKLQGKINDEDKQKILDKCNEIISWLDKNQTAEKEEFEHQQKELEKVCNPIITKLYQSAGGMPGGMPGGFPGGGAPPSGGASSGPTIEEVD